MTKLAIATPSTGTIKTKTVESLIAMCKNLPFDYHFLSHEGSIIHHMRERLVKKAIELECTHLLFVDSDMVFEKDAVLKLLEADKDIIGANYHKRILPLQSLVKLEDMLTYDENIGRAKHVGTGFLLIKLSIFDFLPEPWFFWESNENGDLVTSEDYWFCRLARDKGFEVWVDMELEVKHCGDYMY